MPIINAQSTGFTIVLGNEKGGTGKSTVSMHIVTYLIHLGFKVGSIDVDARQGTLTQYIENRKIYCTNNNIKLGIPDHIAIHSSKEQDLEIARNGEKERFLSAIATLKNHDFIIIDTPGTDSNLSRIVHSYANLLITPLNDSFIDLDVLGKVDFNTGKIIRPSQYAEMVWEQKKVKAMRKEATFDWLVMRNRLSNLYAKNKEDMHKTLKALSKRVGFRNIEGFGERVIFRELFTKGLTVLDLKQVNIPMSLSHVAARQELRNLVSSIKLPAVQEKLEKAC